MRLSKTQKENMQMCQNLPKLTAQVKEQNRMARNKNRKLAQTTNLVIVPLPTRAGNPKKDARLRRERGKLGVYIPFVLLNPRYIKNSLTGKRTVFAGYRGFSSTNKDQKKVNNALIMRAHQARADGGYLHINQQEDHEKTDD